MLLLACVSAMTSALPDIEVHKGTARGLWASNYPTPTPTSTPTPLPPRSGPVIWMGNPDEFEAATVDGLLELSPSPSRDSEDEWNRRDLIGKQGKNRRGLGKGPCETRRRALGKGKKGRRALKSGKCDAAATWECNNGVLNVAIRVAMMETWRGLKMARFANGGVRLWIRKGRSGEVTTGVTPSRKRSE